MRIQNMAKNQNPSAKEIADRFISDFYTNKRNSVQYNFNLLDEQCGSIKENSHTNILMKLLEYKNQYGYVFLDDFISSLTDFEIKIEGDVKFEKEYFDRTDGKQGRIDGLIYQKNKYAIIIENKINHATNQKEQLERYVKSVIGEGGRNEKIVDVNNVYVIFLTQSGVEDPDDYSRDYLIKKGILNAKDKTEPLSGPRYFACSYREHILPWLKEKIQPIVMQKEQILNTGLLQYIDFLEGMLGLRKSDVELLNKGKEMVMNWLKENSYDITKNFRKTNQYLDGIRSIKSNQLDRLAKTNNWNIVELRRYAGLLTNIIEEINDEPMTDFFDITRNYFESNKLMNECVISHIFNYYYIQIRKASWPRSIHFEWYPLGVERITNKKFTDFKFCFHVEGSKEIRDKFKNNTQLNKYFKIHDFSVKEHNRQLSYSKVFKSEDGNPFIDTPDKKVLRTFLETTYGEIKIELIEIIDLQIESIKK